MMTSFYGLVVVLLFFSLVSNKKHFLMTLLVLEGIMVLLLFSLYFSVPSTNIYFYLVFITLSACEGALGLSILVNLSRSYSSDFLLMLNSLV